MVNVDLKFPVLIIKKDDSKIYSATERDFGKVSKGGEKFYKNIVIYDSTGSVFKLTDSSIKGKADFFTCIKFFQIMYELNLIFIKELDISLDEFKKLIKEQLKKNPKYWLALGPIEDIVDDIGSCKSYKDIILKFL